MSERGKRYLQRGVSSSKAEVHAAVARLDPGLFPGAFCRIVANTLASDTDCLVLHSDDVGTKTSLAYMAWKEGFGETVWHGIAQDSLVMNIDDCACVGATGPFLVTNTIARNAKRVPGEVVGAIVEGYEQFIARMQMNGIQCRIVGGETSDCGDVVRTLFVESTVLSPLKRGAVIDADRIEVGDAIVSFSSTGQAMWEAEPNSGIGSNGLTNARHEVLARRYMLRYPETFSPEMDERLVYCGRHELGDPLPSDARFTVGSALLSPTRAYAPLIKKLLRAIPIEEVHALIHCTGGGQTKILRFGGRRRPLRYVKDDLFPVPALFKLIKECSGHGWREMYEVFNMGQLLEAVVSPSRAEECVRVAAKCGIEARVSGRVEPSQSGGNEVVIRGADCEYVYSDVCSISR